MTIRSAFVGLLVSGLCVVAGRPLLASHSWGGYHWAGSGSLRTLSVGDNLTSVWDPYLSGSATERGALLDWNSPTDFGWTGQQVIYLQRVAGGTNPKTCRPNAGRIEVCNASYGKTGWLGIAQIWVSGGHITQGTTKLNDAYFNTATYNKPTWRRMVTCQEVAHDFGLAHQDEAFDNPNLGSCMDYTNNPARDDGHGNNERPNAHDFEELALVYDHLDTAAAPVTSAQAGGNAPAEWGRLVRSNGNGRVQVYERDLGGAGLMITHVFWADPVNDARASER